MKIHFLLISIWISSLSFNIIAQEFQYSSQIKPIDKSGFYNIQLTPEIVSRLSENEGDIRLYDDKNKEIPFIYKKENSYDEIYVFKTYKIISKIHDKNKRETRIVFENPNKTIIQQILMVIKNTQDNKYLDINGSDDKNQWYAIRRNYYFESEQSYNDTSVIKIMNLPFANYKYYEIVIDDWMQNPINVQKIGYWDYERIMGKYSVIQSITFSQIEEKSNSKIIISTPKPNFFDRLEFEISEPEKYVRSAKMIENVLVRNKKGLFIKIDKLNTHVLESFQLCSFCSNKIAINRVFSYTLTVTIENNSDAPLKIKNIRGYVLNSNVIAKLDSGKTYELKFGNSKVYSASYDLNYFEDSLPKEMVILKPDSIKPLKSEKAIKGKSFFGKSFIWMAIAFVAGFLLVMTYNMLKNLKNKP